MMPQGTHHKSCLILEGYCAWRHGGGERKAGCAARHDVRQTMRHLSDQHFGDLQSMLDRANPNCQINGQSLQACKVCDQHQGNWSKALQKVGNVHPVQDELGRPPAGLLA